MQTALAGYAANGSIVHYLDLTLVLENVTANPSAYGFTNLGPCAPIPTCVPDSTYANQFVFWVDAVHPTSRTSALFAQYIATQLQAPLTFGATSDLGLETGRHFGRTLTGRMDLAARGAGDQGFRVFVTGDYLSRDADPDGATDSYQIRDYGVTGGVEYGFENGLIGIAGNYSRPKAVRDRCARVAEADAGHRDYQGRDLLGRGRQAGRVASAAAFHLPDGRGAERSTGGRRRPGDRRSDVHGQCGRPVVADRRRSACPHLSRQRPGLACS